LSGRGKQNGGSPQATTRELADCGETVKLKKFLTPFRQDARMVNVRRGKQKAIPTTSGKRNPQKAKVYYG